MLPPRHEYPGQAKQAYQTHHKLRTVHALSRQPPPLAHALACQNTQTQSVCLLRPGEIIDMACCYIDEYGPHQDYEDWVDLLPG